MSALRQSDITRLEDIAQCAFSELDLGFAEVYKDEILEKVLVFVNARQYSPVTLTRISLAVEEDYYSLDQFNDWMSGARTNLQRIERLAAHSIVRELRAMIGIKPRHGAALGYAGWIFLGRIRRNLQELPLTPEEAASPKLRDRIFDLWGRPNGTAVMIHGRSIGVRVFEQGDPLDSRAREAFRRLAKEVVSTS